MKTLRLSMLVLIWIILTVTSNAHGCTYCPAGPSQPVSSQLTIPSFVWETLVIGGVIGGWIIIFGLFKENTI